MKNKKYIARTDEDKKRKRKLILDNAMKLFVKRGFFKTTIDEIAKNSNLSKGLIYCYFKNKEEIFIAITEETMAFFNEEIEDFEKMNISALKKLEKLGEITFIFYEKHLDICRMLIKIWGHSAETFTFDMDTWTKKMYRIYRKKIADIIIEGIKNKEIRKNIDPPKAATMILALLDGLMIQWMLEPSLFNVKEYKRAFKNICLKSIMAKE